LRGAGGPDVRAEFALALARLTGSEHHYIQMQRGVASDPGTTFSQEVTSAREALARAGAMASEVDQALEQSALAFAQDDLSGGAESLHGAFGLIPLSLFEGPSAAVLRACSAQIGALGSERSEYLVLALLALDSLALAGDSRAG
jgi:hypothetical protein